MQAYFVHGYVEPAAEPVLQNTSIISSLMLAFLETDVFFLNWYLSIINVFFQEYVSIQIFFKLVATGNSDFICV